MSERYHIQQLIRKDSIGGLYLAEDETLGRKVAFRNFEKIVGESILTEPNEEFSHFAGKLSALQHPNLLTIYDISFDEGEAYMVTQHMEDESLADRLKKGAVPQDRVYQMAKDVLEALHAAHDSGVYHGALNAQSVHRVPVASGGHRYMVMDLGLNHLASIIRGNSGGIIDPVMLPPEMHDGGDADAKVDLFMLGQLCYTALAGGHPFAEMEEEECAERYRENALPDIEKFAKGIEKKFIEWILHLARGDASERPQDAEEAMQLLSKIDISSPEPITQVQPGVQLLKAPQAATATSKLATGVAVSTTQATQGMSASQALSGAAEKHGFEPQATSKKPLIIIGALSLIIAAVVLFIVFGDGGKGGEEQASTAGTHSGLMAAPDDAVIYMHSSDPIDAEPIDLETSGVLDWSVTTGKPVSSSRERRKNGKYISNVLQVGDFKEVADDKMVMKFEAGDKKITAKGISGNQNGATAGDGWEVYLRIPQNHKGPLLLKFYLLHENAGLNIEATAPKEKEPIKLNVDSHESGKTLLLLEIPSPVPNGFYTFKLLAGATKEGDSFKLGLHAIQVGEK